VFNWTSSNTTVATVDGTGRVTARALGTARIDASADGRTGSTTVTVIAATVARVVVTPPSSSVVILGTTQLSARLESADGTEIKGPLVTWSSSNAVVASVDQTGLVTGAQVGSATITASAQGHSGTATVFVADRLIASIDVVPATATVLVGDSVQFSAVLRASDGSILSGRTIVWSTSNSATVVVNPVIAPATWARAVGAPCVGQTCTVIVRGTAEGKTDSAVVIVAKRVATVVITPPNDTLAIGAAQQFSATLRASDNTVLTLRGIAWSSTHPAAVALSRSTGDTTTASALALPAPCAVGQTHCVARIIATSEGRADTANISVPKSITQVQVTPANPIVNPGGAILLTARALAADGTDMTGGLTFSWASSSTNVTLSPAGNGTTKTATGLANPSCPTVVNTCSATVTATLTPGGTAGGTTVGVRKPVAQVVVSPDSVIVNAAQTLGVSALVRATDNSSITDRVVTWVSANTAIATATGVGAFQLTANVAGLANPTCAGDPCSTTVRATTETWPGSGTARADTIPVRVYKAIDSVQIRVNGVRVDSVSVKILTSQAVTAVVFAGTTVITRPVGWFESSASFSVSPATGPGTTITAGALPAAPAALTAVACPVGVTPSLTCTGGRSRSINVRVTL
jgi:uncharacterized protein YjdB